MAKTTQKFKIGDWVRQDDCLALVIDDSQYYLEGYILLDWIGLDWQEKFPVYNLKLLSDANDIIKNA